MSVMQVLAEVRKVRHFNGSKLKAEVSLIVSESDEILRVRLFDVHEEQGLIDQFQKLEGKMNGPGAVGGRGLPGLVHIPHRLPPRSRMKPGHSSHAVAGVSWLCRIRGYLLLRIMYIMLNLVDI